MDCDHITRKNSAVAEMAKQTCIIAQFEFLLSSVGEPHLIALCHSDLSEYHHRPKSSRVILLKTRFDKLPVHFCRRQYRSDFNHCDVIGLQSYRIW